MKYILFPSGVNAHAPSSNSLFTSESIFSVFSHLPFSSRFMRNMSDAFCPVIPLTSSPLASLRVDVISPSHAELSKSQVAQLSGTPVVTHEVVGG